MIRQFILLQIITALLLFVAACGARGGSESKAVKSATAGNLNVALSTSSGQLKHGGDEFTIAFTDASGKPVEVGAVAVTFHMSAIGTMAAMNDRATMTATATPGVYKGNVKIEVAGEWEAQVSYEGPAGRGQTSFPVLVH
ncbi:MAG: FixH family protein [Pyrinomonadaceae bacterium]